MDQTSIASSQLLHLVFGGELTRLDGTEFRDPGKLDIVGIFPDFASAQLAWRARAQASVDNAMVRYFIVHLHRFLDPSTAAAGAPPPHGAPR